MAKFLLGLGSNLGDRMHNLNHAIGYLSEFIAIKSVSSIYKSEALLLNDSPNEWKLEYLNMCILGISNISPQKILIHLKTIEEIMGRSLESISWAPRTIDIDILMVDDIIMNTKELIIPHDGLLMRDFVLIPAKEIAYNMIHPIKGKKLIDCNYCIDTGCKKI